MCLCPFDPVSVDVGQDVGIQPCLSAVCLHCVCAVSHERAVPGRGGGGSSRDKLGQAKASNFTALIASCLGARILLKFPVPCLTTFYVLHCMYTVSNLKKM